MKKITEKATAARFLLGGIGTGNISIDQNARLTDFEVWNTPNKGFRSPYTFFAVHTKDTDGKTTTKALESQLHPPFNHSHGFHAWEIGGLPRFKHSEMSSSYPFVDIKLIDGSMPISAELEAFTPFIPLETDDSSIPAFMLRYKIKNTSSKVQEVSVAGTLANLSHLTGTDIWTKPLFDEIGKNTYVDEGFGRGIYFTPANKKPDDYGYLDMALLTTEKNDISYRERWNEGAWWDGLQDFWNDFTADGELADEELFGKGNRVHQSDLTMGSLCIKKSLEPNEEQTFEFVISWYCPNRIRSWSQTSEMQNTPL